MQQRHFAIRQAGLGITLLTDPAGRKLPGNRRYAVYDAARRELAPETAAEIAPPELCKLAEWLSANIGDCTDDKQIGVSATKDRASANCKMSFHRFGQWNIPVADRGTYDLATGLGQGQEVQPVSLACAERLAPCLSRCLNDYYKTQPVPAIESAAEKADREKAESEAAQQAERDALAEAEQNKRRERRDAVVSQVATVLAGGKGQAIERAEKLLTVLEQYFGLSGR